MRAGKKARETLAGGVNVFFLKFLECFVTRQRTLLAVFPADLHN